jgi:uncharacterized phage infection (PIP) family protein YhgE
MGEERPSSRTGAPWWQEPEPPAQPEPDSSGPAETTAPSPPELSWFERREPFLKALSARIEPVEQVVALTAAALQDTRTELASFVEETGRTLRDLSAAVAGLGEQLGTRAGALDRQVAEGVARLSETLSGEITTASEALTAAVRASARETAQEATARTDEGSETVLERVSEASEEALAGLREAEEALRARLGEVEAALRTGVDEAARDVRGRMEQAEEALRTRLGEVDEAGRGRLAEATTGLGEVVGDIGSRLDAVATAQQVDSVKAALDDAIRSLRQTVGEVRAGLEHAVRSTGVELREASGRDTGRLADRLSGPLRAVQTGLGRVDRLASVIDSLGRRRGFQELIEAERALRAEQTAFVDRLTTSSARVAEGVEDLAGRIDRLEEGLRAAAEDTRQLPGHASERVTAAMEQTRATMEEALEQRFDRSLEVSIRGLRAELERGVPVQDLLQELRDLARVQAELAKAQHTVEGVADALRSEVVRLQGTIEGWGRPKTVPEVAAQLGALEERVTGLEGRVAGLVDAVADRVTEQVVEALEAKGRRGLFRR